MAYGISNSASTEDALRDIDLFCFQSHGDNDVSNLELAKLQHLPKHK
jgi:hypothetical protein